MSNRIILWALHVIGPDDVYAAPSWAAAAEAATYLEYHMTQSRLRKEPDLPVVSFAVIPWPHSPESHAKEVLRWQLECYPGPAASALETVPECPHDHVDTDSRGDVWCSKCGQQVFNR